MKITKLFIFILLSFLLGNMSTVNATEVTDSVTVTVVTCPPPTTQIVKMACDVKPGMILVSGEVTRLQTKTPPPNCSFGTPVTYLNSDYVSDNCVYAPAETVPVNNTTSTPTGFSATSSSSCGSTSLSLSWNSVSGATSYRVVRSNYPSPIYTGSSTSILDTGLSAGVNYTYTLTAIGPNGTSAGTSTSGYISPCSSCPAPTTQTVKVACDPQGGVSATSGEVTRLQTKVSPSCTFGNPVTTSNSTYVSDTCVYPSVPSTPSTPSTPSNPTPTAPVADGYWSDWSVDLSQCPSLATKTRYCSGGANKCILNGVIDADGIDTQSYPVGDCPSIDFMSVTFKNENVGGTLVKIPYNSIVGVNWGSSNTNSCSCSSLDSNGLSSSCGSGTMSPSPNKTPALKRDTTYTVSCSGEFGSTVSESLKVYVDDINAGYIEQ